ncbi:MAG: calcium/sodium antiporter [Pseudomonadota bacterium]
MTSFEIAGFVGGGLALLLLGGELLVRGAVATGQRLGLSPVVIGMVIVGFGTSSPELFVGIQAALSNASSLALGNVVGSNVTNVLLILGLAAVFQPIPRPAHFFRLDAFILVAASVGVVALGYVGPIGTTEGLVMLAAMAAVIIFQVARCYIYPDAVDPAEIEAGRSNMSLLLALALLLLGFVALWKGADWLVVGSVEIATRLNISEELIGLTVVAIGTSLPELSSIVIAAVRRQGGVALGGILGSNIFNLLAIIGATAVTAPILPGPVFLLIDGPIMIGVALLMIFFVITGRGISRLEGGLLMACFVGFMLFRIGLEQAGRV